MKGARDEQTNAHLSRNRTERVKLAVLLVIAGLLGDE